MMTLLRTHPCNRGLPPFHFLKPNEWEQGYHCVIDTYTLATNLINLKNKKINEVFILFSE